MNTRRLAAVSLALALSGASGWSVAAGPSQPATHDGGSSMMGGGMMSGGMMGHCPMMGQLPPGNEKLAMQMHGEMMKAMGDIMLKYADKIQTPPAK
ncbi:hypothetical protein [Paraburkholderia fungorum]|jgi:hypothetical protein|uniref:Lipid-binding transport protein (Tim44 family) n=1 Tax=Paraburkholderia fungorum TaxID=134537 RepID=A0AAW3V243_9BURK|nr:hypothetical protein [Paraburkholderia fungorum]AJZ56474.1 hypothetical protein OI25_8231 [Paraburkholderia fungorum]MBB4516535.1 putative lipid-binding transport protein (Tim44 family) [Paraburkholderia fungorum]MBB5545207.1 putative lipid-binding transport protein (Tim44 family) [Paraburkholderia fungorum]MBB6204992.1 putative lipid-binding transport protein (Tim44 family) [Paraburkholderia fungorum]MBU7440607.1 hypothetical protein [Paraburkholderia fungorum]